MIDSTAAEPSVVLDEVDVLLSKKDGLVARSRDALFVPLHYIYYAINCDLSLLPTIFLTMFT